MIWGIQYISYIGVDLDGPQLLAIGPWPLTIWCKVEPSIEQLHGIWISKINYVLVTFLPHLSSSMLKALYMALLFCAFPFQQPYGVGLDESADWPKAMQHTS